VRSAVLGDYACIWPSLPLADSGILHSRAKIYSQSETLRNYDLGSCDSAECVWDESPREVVENKAWGSNPRPPT